MRIVTGKVYRHCDGVSRRGFLAAGALGFGGLTLADLLRAEAASGIPSSRKALVNVHLDGGPPQMDLIDLKPEAPLEIRGELRPIRTKVPGIEICELLPRLAGIADRIAFIRSLVGAANEHNAFQCLSGFDERDLASIGGRPALGCILSKLWGSPGDPAPAFVDLLQGRALVRNSARPGFLGPAYGPFRPDISHLFSRPLEEGMVKELARLGAGHSTSLALTGGLTVERLDDRVRLLGGLDRLRREVDASGSMDAMDRFTRQALGILTSGRFAEAMDLSREDPRSVARYTLPEPPRVERFETGDDASASLKFLMARRLIEAGVRCVTISLSDFDTHSKNFERMRYVLPVLDCGLHALITDLEERGMLGDVAIVVWGEFGRTPKINGNAGGRDHWPKVGMAMLAGGGIRGGQVVGATDRWAAEAVSRPVDYKDVFATLYRCLGIDPHATTLTDPTGRPQHLLDRGEPIKELVG
ncbi:MAG: DUF1501 domain-containing protein [Planctomycetes bacterium]|nr:DUF1501 domain-containing protein [Planctomycetota bacterium]